MNWNDITIGNGNKGNMANRMNISELSEQISENVRSYWISDCFLDTGMVVFKDTPQGEFIKDFIKCKDWEGLSDYLTQLVRTELSISVLKGKIDTYAVSQYREGYIKCQEDMRQVLGI